MIKRIICAGFGGQGALSIGKSLVEVGMNASKKVTWSPSYGPEMRGGTANCSVVISDEPIGSPVFAHPSELVAMSLPALNKFEPMVQEGGVILVNSSVIDQKVERTDIDAYYVPCLDIANELGNAKVANMVMLGAYVAATGAFEVEMVEKTVEEMFTGRKAKLVPMNKEAIKRGMQVVNESK